MIPHSCRLASPRKEPTGLEPVGVEKPEVVGFNSFNGFCERGEVQTL